MKNQFMFLSLCCCVGLLIGCTPDRPFQPGTDYPEWGFDKPAYYEPAQEPVPFVKGTNGEPDIYYTAQRMVFIKRPDYPDLREAPRPAVFTTKDNGQSWKKEGHFGLGEPYFGLLLPDEDGNYGVCVIGIHRSDLAPANLQIQQVYVLDSQAPVVEITLDPEEGPYWTGQNIRLSWQITDDHLGPQPATLCSRIVDPDRPSVWRDQKDHLDASGQINVTVEQLPATAKGFQFRVEAIDQMGNIGVGYTRLLKLMDLPPGDADYGTQEIYVAPRPEQEQSNSTIRQPLVEPTPATTPRVASDNMPPWSWDGQVEAKSSAQSVTSGAMPMPEVAAEAEPAIASTTRVNQPAPDSEMAELEQLLADVSSPVYRGKVQKMPESEPMVQATPVIATKTPAKAQPLLRKPPATVQHVQQPIVTKTAPAETMPMPTAQVRVRPITVAQASTPQVSPEPEAPIIVREPIVLAKPETDEPIITVLPPAKPEPKPIVAAPQPPIVAPVEPSVEPGMIVTAKPPAQTVAKTASSAAPPQVPSVSASRGKTRMAKPWERLGNPDTAARDFYTHAPTLSNY